MRFSNRAYKYLDRLKRDKDWTISDPKKLINYLLEQNIPQFEKIIEFQTDFSGLELTISGKPGDNFKATLFSKSDIIENSPIDIIQINGQYYFNCGDHQTAQFWFVISDKGEIGTHDRNDNSVNIIFSAFEKLIETYSLVDKLISNRFHEYPAFFEIKDKAMLDSLTEGFTFHYTTNDNYNKWLSHGNLIFQQATWFDRPAPFIHIYGIDKETCETFVNSLTNKRIIA